MTGGENIMSGIVLNRHVIISNKLLVALTGISKWTSRNGKYVYEKHNFHISESYLIQKWSKSAIRQFLTYVSICNNQGAIHFASEYEIAQFIGCSVRTIQENNKKFQENGILSFSRIWGEFLDIQINNYTQEVRDLVVQENGVEVSSKTGYTSVWHEVIHKIISLSNINEIRLALRVLLTFEKEVNVQQLDEAILSYEEVKGFLPRYIGYKKAIKEMVAKLSSFITVSCLESREMVKELYDRQLSKQRSSLVDKLSKPFAVTAHFPFNFDSKSIRDKERSEVQIHLFNFKKAVQGVFPVNKVAFPIHDSNSLADNYGSEVVKHTLERLAIHIKDKTLSYAKLERMAEHFKAAPATFLRHYVESYHMAKTIKN